MDVSGKLNMSLTTMNSLDIYCILPIASTREHWNMPRCGVPSSTVASRGWAFLDRFPCRGRAFEKFGYAKSGFQQSSAEADFALGG
jgi:hypothetical protein